ncbi:MAG TPA: hypothetical protein PKI20_13485 [Verrucomicrobiota bacterium]|jgi:hypothetical protein|nr:hypothetical protein [Verrucomicrobiota bacterium]HQL78714.1 hypothetical protein [Verrucomicrobiota bacterium]
MLTNSFRWIRIPRASVPLIVHPDGTMEELGPEIGTSEAARMMSCARRTIQSMCDEGRLQEGRDWRKLRGRGGRGHYRIKVSAILRLKRA